MEFNNKTVLHLLVYFTISCLTLLLLIDFIVNYGMVYNALNNDFANCTHYPSYDSNNNNNASWSEISFSKQQYYIFGYTILYALIFEPFIIFFLIFPFFCSLILIPLLINHYTSHIINFTNNSFDYRNLKDNITFIKKHAKLYVILYIIFVLIFLSLFCFCIYLSSINYPTQYTYCTKSDIWLSDIIYITTLYMSYVFYYLIAVIFGIFMSCVVAFILCSWIYLLLLLSKCTISKIIKYNTDQT